MDAKIKNQYQEYKRKTETNQEPRENPKGKLISTDESKVMSEKTTKNNNEA